MGMTRAVFFGVLFLSMTLTACDRYEVVGREQKDVPNFDKPGTHIEVDYVLSHNGHRIYGACDLSTIDSLDPNASCGFRVLHTYTCELQSDSMENATTPMSDLKCKDADGHNVYLYVSKKE
jgi:hypothetical protein